MQPLESFTWTVLTRIQTDADRALFEACYALYEATFPEDSERETKEAWEAGLRGGAGYAAALIVAHEDGNVAGGVAHEFYPKSGCGLVTFVFVHPDYRRHGIARALIERARERLQEGRALAVFAEAEDPEEVEARGIPTTIDPRVRLKILDRLGARKVDIRYVQPPLGPGKRPAEHLLLLVLADPDMNGETTIARRLVESFLMEFHTVLGLEPAESDRYLERAFEGREGEKIRLLPLTSEHDHGA